MVINLGVVPICHKFILHMKWIWSSFKYTFNAENSYFVSTTCDLGLQSIIDLPKKHLKTAVPFEFSGYGFHSGLKSEKSAI